MDDSDGREASNGAESTAPLVWLLLGDRRGDNNQMLALAAALGVRTETKKLSYNSLRNIPPLRRRALHLSADARASLAPPWPDLVIGLGANSVPIAREIKRRSGGKTRLIHIGDPRGPSDDLDLLITTPQFARCKGPNVLSLALPMGNPAEALKATPDERKWLAELPHPRRLVAIGGWTRKWKLDEQALGEAIAELQARSSRDGGSVIAVTSPRTERKTMRLLDRLLTGPSDALAADFPRFGILLAASDEIYVTADSVSMLSEAILTGKPVGMIPIKRTMKGWVSHAARRLGLPYRVDMANFWRYLHDNRLVGSVSHPVASEAGDSLPVAVRAVRRILRR